MISRRSLRRFVEFDVVRDPLLEPTAIHLVGSRIHLGLDVDVGVVLFHLNITPADREWLNGLRISTRLEVK